LILQYIEGTEGKSKAGVARHNEWTRVYRVV
jgi:hypothetical protein